MTFTQIARFAATILIPAMLSNSLGVAQPTKTMKPAAVKAKLEDRGLGRGVRITLVDKTELKGLIVSIGGDSCEIKAKGQGTPQTVAYAQITGIHRDKMSTGAKVGIAAGVVVVAFAVLVGIGAYMFAHSKF